MNLPNTLMWLILVLSTLCTDAKEINPSQESIDSLLRVIDKIAGRDYVHALEFIDSTLSVTESRPAYTTQYLYIKMKRSSVLLKAKAHSTAFQNLLEIEPEINRHPDVLVKAFHQVMMAFIYGDQGNFNLAIPCYHRALEFYHGTGQFRKMAITRNNLADCYLAMGDARQALDEINRAIALRNEHRFDNAEVIYSTAGEIELGLRNYEKALSYFNRA